MKIVMINFLRRTTMIEEFVSEMATLKEKADSLRGYL
jgi:hypothetical protein